MDALPESVWQFSGPLPGPRVLVLGGVHGNEVTGVMIGLCFESGWAGDLTERGFAFAPSRGERSFEPFSKDDLIGAHGEMELHAPYDGVLLFPKVPELWKVGSPVAFLARVKSRPGNAGAGELDLDA
jgi:hypothetical protein